MMSLGKKFATDNHVTTQVAQARYIEDITRWREDMNFMFEWQEQYLTSERSERVRYCSCHEKKIDIFEPTCNVLFIIWRY